MDSGSVDTAPPPGLRDTLVFVRRLLLLVRPYWARLAKNVAMGVCLGSLAMVSPLISKSWFDQAYPTRDVSLVQMLVLASGTIGIATSVLTALRTYYGQIGGAWLNTELTLLFVNHVQHLPATFFDTRRSGEILSRAGDLQRSVGWVTGVFHTLVVRGFFVVAIPPVLFALHWRLATVALLSIPITTSIALYFGRKIRLITKLGMEASADASGYQYEVVSNNRLIKLTAAETDVFATLRALLLSAQAKQLSASFANAGVAAINGIVSIVTVVLFTWYGWTLVLRGEMTLGGFVAFTAYQALLRGPLGELANLLPSLQNTAVSLGRFFEYYDIETEQNPRAALSPTKQVPRHAGRIVLRDVAIGYGDNAPILRDVNIAIGPGINAIVGHSGSGKSSIIKTVMRLYPLRAGTIEVGESPYDRLPLHVLRRQFSVVPQDNAILRGSIRDNILLGSDQSHLDRDIFRALAVAQIDTFVSSLPGGLDTQVAEWGGTISAGQRQRLAIGRAILANRPFLVLDEATSNLDPETEERLLDHLLQRDGNAAIILITHRLLSASRADRVFLVADGSVSGGCGHKQMLGVSERYRQMWTAANHQTSPL